jgi:hypothetical protein
MGALFAPLLLIDPDPLAALTTNPPPKGVSYFKVASK